MFRMALKQTSGERITLLDLFSEVEHLPNLILAALLCSFLLYFSAACLVIPGVIMGELLMFTIPIIIDRKKGAPEAIGLSFKTLLPHFGTLLVVWLYLFIVHLIGTLLCGLGLLVAVPMMPITITVIYRDFFPV